MRVLMLSLDGLDIETARRLDLPTIARLDSTTAVARLDSGDTYLTGMTGEQMVTGLRPDDGGRQSTISFDPATYTVTQQNPLLPPALGGVETVVIDPCYFDLAATPDTVGGIVDWGCHDPGGDPQERPAGLRNEIISRFGTYPADRCLYEFPWSSSERCEQMGQTLSRAVRARSEMCRWLLADRLPGWTMAYIGTAEAHSATEAFFHGMDPDHPLAGQRSAPAARDALVEVYRAVDEFVGEVLACLPDDVATIVFSPHGMGSNGSDVASMLLLGELLVRWSGGSTPELTFPIDGNGVAHLGADEEWGDVVWQRLNGCSGASPLDRARRLRGKAQSWRRRSSAPGLHWMPLVRHQPRWSTMRAFALPSYFDGRIRVNVIGRESRGRVAPGSYASMLDELESMLRECRDPRTGEPVVGAIDRPFEDPMSVSRDAADLIVRWRGFPFGIEHHEIGRIGPVPARRTGGHTSPHGAAFISGPGFESGDIGQHSPFDLLPTALQLAGSAAPQLSGRVMSIPGAA